MLPRCPFLPVIYELSVLSGLAMSVPVGALTGQLLASRKWS